jgi:hypothetical protein
MMVHQLDEHWWTGCTHVDPHILLESQRINRREKLNLELVIRQI